MERIQWSFPIEQLSKAIKQSIETVIKSNQAEPSLIEETYNHYAKSLDGKGMIINVVVG